MKAGLREITLVAAIMLPPVMAAAQDAADITQRFREQLQKTRSLEPTPDCKTRGLIITPGTETAGSEADAAVEVTEADVSYCVLPGNLQVAIRVGFAFDSAVLVATEADKLGPLCEAMRSVPDTRFQVIGHSDAAGTDAYNMRLSALRAGEVRRFLISDCGIDGARLDAVGVGEGFLADTEDPLGAANRRVEFQALG